jgi:hypothetical protein
MTFVKGKSGNPSGKPVGAINGTTKDARAAIAMFVDKNVHRLEGWLDKVAETNPQKAFELFQSVVEYHVPKLARVDNTSSDGSMNKTITVNFIGEKSNE